MKILIDTCVVIDALQDCIVTRNKKDYDKSLSVAIYTPDEFLALPR